MVERTLREGLSSSVRTKIGGETERLHNGQVSKESHLGCSRTLLLSEDVTTTTGENSVYVTHGILWNRNITEVNRLEKTGLGSQQRRKANPTGGRHDLSHTTMDGISVKYDIHKVETACTHLFLTKWSVLGGPGESSYNGFLNFKKVVDSLGGINKKVRSSSIRSEGPDFTGLGYVPSIIISHKTSLNLLVSLGADVSILNGIGKLSSNGISLYEKTVMLVSRLRKTSLVGLGGTGLTE
eukprot:954062_1